MFFKHFAITIQNTKNRSSRKAFQYKSTVKPVIICVLNSDKRLNIPFEVRCSKVQSIRHEEKFIILRICLCRQNVLSLDSPNTYKYMHRQWILIGQSILKTIRTMGDKKCPSRGGRNRMRTCAKLRPVTAGTVINGLTFFIFFSLQM